MSANLESEPAGMSSGVHQEDDDSWSQGDSQERQDQTIDETNDEMMPKTAYIPDVDDSDDEDDIQVTIGDYEPHILAFQTNPPRHRPLIPTNPMQAPRANPARGVNIDEQGMINGQSTFEHEIGNAYKDDEKPWKKPGADISDYFNYGFSEETWTQYCDRQRRLRAENNLARMTMNHMPNMPPMMGNHLTMGQPLAPHQMMMMNRPMNVQMVPRPMNARRPDGRIGVIGTTDQTSRRNMLEPSNNPENPSFANGPSFPTDQSLNGQTTVGDLASTQTHTNEHPTMHDMPPNNFHHIQTIGVNRVPLMPLQSGIPYRPPFVHPHAMGGPQYFPRGPMVRMHGERLSQPYLIPSHPQQTWNETVMAPQYGFPPGSVPSQTITSSVTPNPEQGYPSRGNTPENRKSHSATPEENRPTTSTTDQNDKSTKEDRYKERNDRDSRSSSSYRSHYRSSEHEYERHSRSRHYHDDRERSSHRTSATKTNSTANNESSQTSNSQSESISDSHSSSRSSSHRQKSSKRSRHDSSDDERSSRHRSHHRHHRRSQDRASHSNTKESINE